MTGGCKGFGKKIMQWPEDLIIGGIKRGDNRLQSAEALQSVFLVASPFDVYLRFKVRLLSELFYSSGHEPIFRKTKPTFIQH